MLIYKVKHDGKSQQTFQGFASVQNINEPPEEAEFLAAVQYEDSTELWWVEDCLEAVEELERYYRMTYQKDFNVNLFRRVQ